MRLIRYQTSPLFNPAVSFPTLRDEMDRLFDAAFPTLGSVQRRREFPVDLYQDKNAVTVRAELPGFRKEDVSVEVADNVLTLTGRPKTETKAETTDKPVATAQERRFNRAISLPENLDVEKIAAAYENGVLTVTLPKCEEVKPKQIAIQVK